MSDETDEPQELPIDGTLDLHTFPPREVAALVGDYLDACRERNILEVRIIHGKGIGALRETVHRVLEKRGDVARFRLDSETASGWGATLVDLEPLARETAIFIDADACPVKDETYRVAKRYGLHVFVVANQWMRVPAESDIELVVVDEGFDAADDWIVERVSIVDVVVTADVPLAGRCLGSGAKVLGLKGKPFTEDSIGDALATRELLSQLRDLGEVSGGPAPFSKQDRSRYLQKLDETIQAIKRERAALEARTRRARDAPPSPPS